MTTTTKAMVLAATVIASTLVVPGAADAQRRSVPRHTPTVVKRGQVVHNLPATHVSLTLGSSRFFYHQGVFYRPRGAGGYIVVGNPIGAITTTVPAGAVRIQLGGRTWFRHGTTFFVAVDGGYTVAEPPIGGTVEALPMGYEIIETESEDLYYHDGIFYRYDPGRDVYLVVEPPSG